RRRHRCGRRYRQGHCRSCVSASDRRIKSRAPSIRYVMVDLPTVPDRIVTSTAPTSSVSRGDIAGSTDLMASALGKVADATMDIATKQAKEQAANDLQQ